MQQPLISFIVPAYNAADYLWRCLDSIHAIDLKGCGREVIVVNDGSTDNTAAVLAEYKAAHPAVRVLEQENLGLSVARNAGISAANGKYLHFVDADDELSPQCYMAGLVFTLLGGDIDIVGINVSERGTDGQEMAYRRYVPLYNKVYTPARQFLKDRNLMPCVWAYIFRREFLPQWELAFTTGIYHEDEDFTTRAFLLAESFVAVDADLYLRILRKGSITTTTDPEKQRRRLRDVVAIIRRLDDFTAGNAEWRDCAACKMDYLVVDTLRVMWTQRHDAAFQAEIVGALRDMGRFPLRWRWEFKYILFNIYARTRAALSHSSLPTLHSSLSLSVIIPVYKVENTLDRCVKSVLEQDVKGMEVILVDDGSPDGCPAICDRWAQRDGRVRVVHKANGGLSDARNAGIAVARDEYIAFVDSDDWLMPDTYRPLMEWLEGHPDCDMLEFSLRHIGQRRAEMTLDDRVFTTPRRYWEDTMAWNHTYACNKIYRRRLFDGVRFPKGKVFEDVITLPSLLRRCGTVATSSHGFYCYEWNTLGISVAASRSVKGLWQHFRALLSAAWVMRTLPFSGHGRNLWYMMLCRLKDMLDTVTGRNR